MTLNPRRWLHEHSLKLLAIRDTPEAIAGGIAIGMYFAFAPLFGFKTLLAILFAWITRSNILAAVIAVTLHELIFPLMPLIYRWEYDVGYWLLNHEWPQRITQIDFHHFNLRKLWEHLLSAGKPLLVGGCLCSVPVAAATFFLIRPLVARHQRKRHARELLAIVDEDNPS
jgi:uncharacterized protein (DUF2062 family)